ncbi:mechanosensitive channel MscK [Haliea sp. E1-2-M8]|uniref:mechanosensitive channel MscK n=1 Tax=Haliea sp. E1-2-M8 TaxID=3064706 RepID=UPI0027202301|nr:mechanosensitive channel MscK [Haliea sp. E1-2-M8]MDO8863530.1 mechanosensitive channel MscK [Haliea sp. E1-2-M8]
MFRFGRFFAPLLLTCGLSPLSSPAIAAEPSVDSLQEELQQTVEASQSDTEKQELQELYQSAIELLRKRDALLEDQTALSTRIEEAPAQIREYRQQLESLVPPSPESIRSEFGEADLATLEERLREQVSAMFELQGELTAVNAELIAAKTRPETAQAQITANQAREQELNEELRQLERQPDGRLNQARIVRLQAEQEHLSETSKLLRRKLLSNAVLQELAEAERALLRGENKALETVMDTLQRLLDEARRSQSLQAVSEATDSLALTSDHQLLRNQVKLNRQLSEELLTASGNVGEMTRKSIAAAQQIENLLQVEQALEQQIDVLRGSVLLSRVLHQQKRALPQIRGALAATDQIADLRLRQFELNEMKRELDDQEQMVSRLLSALPEDQLDALRPDMQQVISNRANLLAQLEPIISSLLSQAITLQLNQQRLRSLSKNLHSRIDDQLIWVASTRRVDSDWLAALPVNLKAQWQDMGLQELAASLLINLRENWPWLLPSLLLLGAYARLRRRLRLRLAKLHEDVRHFRRDTTFRTPLALLLTSIQVAPVPLALVTVGLICLRLEPVLPVTGAALIQLALAWFVLHLLYRVLDPAGLAGRHFRWQNVLVQQLHNLVRNVAWILLPLVLVTTINVELADYREQDALGRLFIIIGMTLLGVLLGRSMWSTQPLYSSKTAHLGITLALAATPLLLAGMTFWGFQYTAVNLAHKYWYTLYLIVVWMLVEGTIVRNLNVAGRHLAYQRALARREAELSREGAESEVAVEVPELDMAQVNEQSLRLAKLAILALFSVLIYLVWSDLVSATAYLDSITLWEYNAGTGDAPELVPMSVADVLGAMIIIIFTVTLARNLPGLLEVLVLSRINLQQGSSYAVTTLLSYVIVSIGFISGLAALGVSWNKLQWLVAALSVGLGFGLQEIFANAVSGIIILFERPVRIGDVVTIGDLSGTVSKIRIRATTITDFDRKEIIVPNKNFVTGQLINWSLHDTITRVTISVGVAYGSDLALTRKLLEQIGSDNPRTLNDPPLQVLFLRFGDSTLNHELRVHVKDVVDRLPAVDEMNREVDRLFRENGIEIAFPQVDLNLRKSEGLDQLTARPAPDSGA